MRGASRRNGLGMRRARIVRWGLVLVFMAAVSAAYYPGLRGPYAFDDHINLHANPSLAITQLDSDTLRQAAASGDSGPLRRPVAMISFAVNHYFAGGFDDTFPFKITNLAIHLINAWLVYWLARLLLKQLSGRLHPFSTGVQKWLPWIVTAIWALHPLQLTSVLYVVQRMTSLSAGFVFVGLILFLHGRQRVQNRRPWGLAIMSAGIVGGLTLGMLSKENAAILVLLTVLLEWIVFDRKALDIQQRKSLYWFYAVTLLSSAVLAIAWILLHPEMVLTGYKFRDFTLTERLLTQPRVLWLYVGLLVFPSTARLTLFHDDIEVSRNLWEPWTTAVALIVLIVVIAVAAARKRENPLLALGVFWFLIGHSIESSFIGLEIAHEHRNYLPDVGLIFAGACAGTKLLHRITTPQIAWPLIVVILAVLGLSTYVRAGIWAEEVTLVEAQLKHHPRSARSHAMAAEFYARNNGDPLRALTHYKTAFELTPKEIGYPIRMALLTGDMDVPAQPTTPSSTIPADVNAGLPDYVTLVRTSRRARIELVPDLLVAIEPQLRTEPISSYTEQMLTAAADCAANKQQRCSHIEAPVIAWLEAALSNTHINSRVRNNLTTVYGQLLVARGNYGRAIELTHEARRLQPDNANFILMEAHIHLLRGDIDGAQKTIAALTHATVVLTPSLKHRAEYLVNMIRAAQTAGAHSGK